MAPQMLYRVEDRGSRARTTWRGARAGNITSQVSLWAREGPRFRQLAYHFRNHLKWRNRTDTPFISVYADESVAHEEASRRKRRGQKDVVLIVFDISQADRRVDYCNVRYLAATRFWRIPRQAWDNSECEYIVLRRIPASAIVEITKMI